MPSSPLCPGAESLVHFCSSGHSAGRVFLAAFWLTDEPSATIAGSSSFPEEWQDLGLDFSKMTTSDLLINKNLPLPQGCRKTFSRALMENHFISLSSLYPASQADSAILTLYNWFAKIRLLHFPFLAAKLKE